MTDKVEIAWAGSFYDDPALLVWTDVTARAFPGVSAALGRDSDMAAVPQARRMSVRLKSYDGALTPGNTASPYYPNVVSGVPIRTSKRDAAGVWWPVFYGLTDTFNPTMNGEVADYTVVTVAAVSAWAALTQAGARRTYADRLLGDLAPAKGEAWVAGIRTYGYSSVLYVAGGVVYGGLPNYLGQGRAWPDVYDPAQDFQRFGLAWLSLDNTGGKAWSTPGAACPVVETGGSDTSGLTADGYLSGGFGGDRPGGQVVGRVDGTCGISAAFGSVGMGTWAKGNFARAQVLVGRPPTQLAPASVSEPTSTAGWTPSGGAVTLVAASTLAHLPRTSAYDPATKTTAGPVIDGPVNAISWAAPYAGTLTSVNIPVVAGKSYGPLLVTSGGTAVTVQWFNAASAYLSTSTAVASTAVGAANIVGAGRAGLVAPAGAAYARIVLTWNASPTTLTVGCVGFYEAQTLGASTITPARWWPAGADAHIYAWVQWPDLAAGGMTAGAAGQVRWLHVQIDVTAWDDGQLHMLAWNGNPGVAGKPVVWADNVRVATGWSASWPGDSVGNDTTHAGVYDGSGMGGGFGNTAGARLATTNPSKLVVPAALLAAHYYETTPDDVSIDRAWSFFGGRKSLSTTYATDTGAQMTRALDQLGWPDALRDIGVGASVGPFASWADLASLSDYSALISDLTKAEYGWVDISPEGHLRWLPRAWYGVGTATAVAHYTWRAPTPGMTAYVAPLDVRWDDKDVANSIVVGNGTDFMTRSRQDITAQRRGLRRLEVTLPGGADQSAIDNIADILAVVHAPGPRIESLTLRAVGADDPMLAQILARKTGDVVLVDLPQLPAPDLTVAMLITSIEHTSDGVVWSAKFGLGVCPIPAVFP